MVAHISEAHVLGALVAGNLTPDAVSSDQWPVITGLALQHGLAPMLHWTLKQAGCDLDVNPVWQPLIHARYLTAIDWAVKERAQLEIDAALRVTGIPAIWLKGSVLARSVYPEPSLRPMGDLDVLVPYEQREAALASVRDTGFDFYEMEDYIGGVSSAPPVLLPISHHFVLRGGIANKVVLELHFRLLGDDEMLSIDQLQWFLGHRQPANQTDKTPPPNTLTPEAHLLYLAAHAVLQHGVEEQYLLRYFDLHRLVTQYSLDWKIVIDQAVALEWTILLERALLKAVEYFDTLVPDKVFEELVTRRSPHEDEQRILQKRGVIFHWKRIRKMFAYMSTVDKLQFLLRTVFPAPAYMRRRFRIHPGKPVWPYYFVRWYHRGRFLSRAIWARVAK